MATNFMSPQCLRPAHKHGDKLTYLYYSSTSSPRRNDLCYAKLLHWTFVFWAQAGFILPWHPDFRCVLMHEHVCKTEGLLRDVVPVGGALARCECCIRHLRFPETQQGCGLTYLPPHATLL